MLQRSAPFSFILRAILFTYSVFQMTSVTSNIGNLMRLLKMANADMMLNHSEKPKLTPGFFYGTLFLDCPEEIANTVRENLSGLFGRVEFERVSGEAFTFAVSA